VLALVAFVIVQAAPQLPTLTLISGAAAVFGLGASGAAGLLPLHGAREASASFVIDDERITRHTWGQATELAWRDVVRLQEFHATGSNGKTGPSGRCVLFDVKGRRLAIPFPWVPDGPRLCALLEPHLARLREAELCELTRRGGRFRPDRRAGILLLTCGTPMLLICGLTTFDSGGAGRAQWAATRPYVGALLVAAAVVIALLGTELISRELVITADSLALRSLFLDRSIPFARVESISVKVIDAEQPGIERLTVRGNDGQTIALDSGVPCYRAVLHLLRSRAAAKACLLTALPEPPEWGDII
jgi:hypothetical protein